MTEREYRYEVGFVDSGAVLINIVLMSIVMLSNGVSAIQKSDLSPWIFEVVKLSVQANLFIYLNLYTNMQIYICLTSLVNLGGCLKNLSGSSLAPSFQYSYSIQAPSGICASVASMNCPNSGASGITPVSSTY